MPAGVDAHFIVEVLSLAWIIAGTLVAMTMRNLLLTVKSEQADTKAELVGHQRDIKEGLTALNAATASDLKAHTVEDKIQFEGINKSLDRIERKLDGKRDGGRNYEHN